MSLYCLNPFSGCPSSWDKTRGDLAAPAAILIPCSFTSRAPAPLTFCLSARTCCLLSSRLFFGSRSSRGSSLRSPFSSEAQGTGSAGCPGCPCASPDPGVSPQPVAGGAALLTEACEVALSPEEDLTNNQLTEGKSVQPLASEGDKLGPASSAPELPAGSDWRCPPGPHVCGAHRAAPSGPLGGRPLCSKTPATQMTVLRMPRLADSLSSFTKLFKTTLGRSSSGVSGFALGAVREAAELVSSTSVSPAAPAQRVAGGGSQEVAV